MLFKVTLRSTWYHKRLLAVILIASWLITGFCALIPLFLDTLSEAASRRIIDDIRAETATLTLSNPRPFAPEALTPVDRELGGMITDKIAFSRAFGGPGYPNLGKICGYDYARGELLTARARYAVTTSDHCYKIYSFAALPDLFRLAEGRWPKELNPELPPPPMTMDAAQIEAVVTPDIAHTAGFEIGDHLVVGDSSDQALIVEIVGLVEPLLPPDDVFWHGHAVVQRGEWTPMGDDMRFDVGLIVPGETFERWILPRSEPNLVYHWWLRADPNMITGENLKTLDANLYRVERDLRAAHPQLELVSGLKTITEQFKADIDRFERPVWVLTGAVLLLMAYQVWVMTRLALDGARSEQAVITSRGASVSQRVAIRAAVIGLAAITSLLVGPLLARAALSIFRQVGPLAVLSENQIPDWADALAETYAGAGGVFLLLLVGVWYTARFPALHSEAEGPAKPLWRRYALDLLLIAAGLAFVLRLYFSATGDLGQSIEALWQSPAALMHQIGTGEQAREDGLGDPFNLTGPVLILVGITLLWLRLYPLLMRLAAPLLRWHTGLVIPMAIWRTGRNAGHYTPLVVMLTATLVLGVASLALDSTVNTRADMMAQQEIGADVRLEYAQVEPGWETLPGVSSSTVVMRLAGSEQIALLGIDPGSTFPALQDAAAQLTGQPSILPGRVLPDDSAAVQIQINTPEDTERTITAQLDMQLVDGRGVPFTVPLPPVEPGITGRFVIYRAALPTESPAEAVPWRLIGFRLRSVRTGISTFDHTIYLDDLAVVDAQGVVTVLEDFEQEAAAEDWAGAASQADTALKTARSAEHAASGAASLQVGYWIRHAAVRELQPLLMVHEVTTPQVPVIISQAFADWQERRSGTGQNLAEGDVGRVQFELAVGRFWLAYQVVDIVPDFPAADSTDRLVIAPFDDLRVALNAQSKPGGYYDANQVWLALESAAPGEDFRQAVADLAGVESAMYARDRYNDMRREPALKAVTGILFAAFWFAWGLYTLTHLVITASRRDSTGRTLGILGLDTRHLRRLWAAEQVLLLVPTLAFGALVSVLLVYLLLPFLTLIKSDTLYLSRASLGAMLLLALTLIVPVMVAVSVQSHANGQK